MKTIDELIAEYGTKLEKIVADSENVTYSAEGFLAQYTLDLILNGHLTVPGKPITRAMRPSVVIDE